ncbi:MAG TPA: FxLYD domain-containing protein [Rhodothermales bacterium]|nr:FxLYD domain-containing protein [Rhodothermales bacterium]
MLRLLPVLAVAGLVLAACKDDRKPAVDLSRMAPGDSSLTLTGITYNHQTGVVAGRIENRTSSAYDSLSVELTLRTFEGDSLAAVALDTVSLDAGQTWRFERTPPVAARESVAVVRVVRYAGTRRDNGERTDAQLNRDVPAPRLTVGL